MLRRGFAKSLSIKKTPCSTRTLLPRSTTTIAARLFKMEYTALRFYSSSVPPMNCNQEAETTNRKAKTKAEGKAKEEVEREVKEEPEGKAKEEPERKEAERNFKLEEQKLWWQKVSTVVAIFVGGGGGVWWYVERQEKREKEQRIRNLPKTIADNIIAGKYKEKVKPDDGINEDLWEHSLSSIKKVFDIRQCWAVFVGLKGVGKSQQLKAVGRELGNAIYVQLDEINANDHLYALLYDKSPLISEQDKELKKEPIHKENFMKEVFHEMEEMNQRPTVLIDLTGEAESYHKFGSFDKQVKEMVEEFKLRVVIASSEGLLFTALKAEGRREIFFFKELSKDKAFQYYNDVNQCNFKIQIEECKIHDILSKMPRTFERIGLAAAAKEKDGGALKAKNEFGQLSIIVKDVLGTTCPTGKKELKNKLVDGIAAYELRHVCNGNFVTLAEKKNMEVKDWFAEKYVKPNIMALPEFGIFRCQCDATKTLIESIDEKDEGTKEKEIG